MRIVSALALAIMLNATAQANVIGPNKDGIYKVDQWGAEKSPSKKPIKLGDKCDRYIIQDETALLPNMSCKSL